MEATRAQQIYQKFLDAKHPVLLLDEHIDGDSLGSCLAMADHLLSLGKMVRIYTVQPIPERYKFLPHLHLCSLDATVLKDSSVDLIAFFDCSDVVFFKHITDSLSTQPVIINIDHHTTNPLFGHYNYVVTHASATAAVLYSIFHQNNVTPSKHAANCLLTGLCYDTTSFTNDATDQQAFFIASELIRLGATPQRIVRSIIADRSIASLRVWGVALERLRAHKAYGVVSTFITRADIETHGVSDEEVDGLANFLHFVSDAHTLFLLKETSDGGVKTSMRSTARDISKIAKLFGGGGHKKAAGFTIPNSHLSQDETQGWKVVFRTKAC